MNRPELISGSSVLDLGCGFGRDAFFMSCSDRNFRQKMMMRISNGRTTLEKYFIPAKSFRVIGIDGCPKMVRTAYEKRNDLMSKTHFDFSSLFVVHDIHYFEQAGLLPFDGIWSCAALFTHTPRPLVGKVLSSIKKTLNDNGIFAVSYTQSFSKNTYNKLLLSRTGRIKYFSQPMASVIEDEAGNAGLKLIYQTQDDFNRENNLVAKNLFMTQFFQNKQ